LPQWGFGTAERMGKDKPRFDFYENNMFLDDPIQADLNRKAKCAAPKIGTEPRVNLNVRIINLFRCKETTLSRLLDLSICQIRNLRLLRSLNTLSAIAEEVVSRLKLQHLPPLVQAAMSLRLLQTPRTNRTSLAGLYPRPEDPVRQPRVLIRTKPTM
jgi:hypothetical protein